MLRAISLRIFDSSHGRWWTPCPFQDNNFIFVTILHRLFLTKLLEMTLSDKLLSFMHDNKDLTRFGKLSWRHVSLLSFLKQMSPNSVHWQGVPPHSWQTGISSSSTQYVSRRVFVSLVYHCCTYFHRHDKLGFHIRWRIFFFGITFSLQIDIMAIFFIVLLIYWTYQMCFLAGIVIPGRWVRWSLFDLLTSCNKQMVMTTSQTFPQRDVIS